MKFYLMSGLCGAGKTTISKQFAQENNCRYISIDSFYKAVFGDNLTHTHRDEVWELCFKALDIAFEDRVDVVLDTNSPKLKNRKQIFEQFAKRYDESYILYVQTDAEQCMKNNRQRDRQIPEEEMKKIINAYEEPIEQELADWTDIYIVRNENNSILPAMSMRKRSQQ